MNLIKAGFQQSMYPAHGWLVLNKNKTTVKDSTWFFTKNISDTFSQKNPFPSTSWKLSTISRTTPMFRSHHDYGFQRLEVDYSVCPGFSLQVENKEFQEIHKQALKAAAGLGHETHQHVCECPMSSLSGQLCLPTKVPQFPTNCRFSRVHFGWEVVLQGRQNVH